MHCANDCSVVSLQASECMQDSPPEVRDFKLTDKIMRGEGFEPSNPFGSGFLPFQVLSPPPLATRQPPLTIAFANQLINFTVKLTFSHTQRSQPCNESRNAGSMDNINNIIAQLVRLRSLFGKQCTLCGSDVYALSFKVLFD